MNMNTALRIAAIYLIIAGVIGTTWALLNTNLNPAGVEGQSLWYHLKPYARELSIFLAFIISGAGLLKYKLWARKVGLVALGLAFFYFGNAMAWTWAGGKPTTEIIIYSYALSFIWFGIWFLILYSGSAVKQLTDKANGSPKNGDPD